MFGTNEIRKATRTPDELYVQEVFHTIQGEGPFTGTPSVFVRMWGCNLRCHFCDTDFESNKQPYTCAELLREIERLAGRYTKLIVFTGGEPFLQDLSMVITILWKRGYTIQMETAGTVWTWDIDPLTLNIVLSPKTPSVNTRIGSWAKHWKYIIGANDPGDPTDGLPILPTQPNKDNPVRLARPMTREGVTIWVQPRMDYLLDAGRRPILEKPDAVRNKANIARCVELALKYGYRVSLQTHKILGVP